MALGGDAGLVVSGEFVYAYYYCISGFYAALVVVGGVLDLLLDPASFDGAEHAAQGFYLREIIFGLLLDAIGRSFYEI